MSKYPLLKNILDFFKFSKSRSAQHHVSELLRDFQHHSINSSTTAANNISESHTRLLDVSDGEYGELYCPSATEDESVDLNGKLVQRSGNNGVGNNLHGSGGVVGGGGGDSQFFDFSSSSFEHDPVPGPAPEVEPPRPAPSVASGVQIY